MDLLMRCISFVSGRIAHRQTGPGGLPEWLADLAPKEPLVRRARFGIPGGMGQEFSPGGKPMKTYEFPMKTYSISILGRY